MAHAEVLGAGQGERLGHEVRATAALPSSDRERGPSRQHRPVGDDRLCWSTVAGLLLIHVAGAAGVVWIIVNPSVPTLALTGSFYAACGLSVTAGYHRLFAHRTYRAAAAVRWALLAFGAATFQNSALSWSADHRAHHADTDGSGDPHPVTRGAWFAHMGWLLHRRQASADVTRLKDLWAVRSIRLQHRCYPVVAVGVGLVLPAVIAAQWGDPWGGLLVAGFLRAAVMLQATFCVNSLAHLVGTRRYDTRSSARDSVLTALVTFGEGYHSFHHRFPFDYRNGPRWWHYDPSKWLIWTLARMGMVNGLRTASAGTIAKAVASARASA
jgi:stearoyl-CoA desaturase (Delta-9 desaturase)